MEPVAALAAAVAIAALSLPAVSALAAGIRRLTLPPPRLGGIVVLCAALSGLARPVVAAVAPPPARSSTPVDPTTPAVGAASYVVQPGDSLWAIACDVLRQRGSATPSVRAVDRLWRSIYDSNQKLIGVDPDLIHPGQALSIPEETA